MRILFTGGGTGGHFYPIIAVAREFKRIAEEERIVDLEFFYLGPDNYGRKELAREDILAGAVWAGKIRRYFSWKNFLDAVRTFVGIVQAFWKLFVILPDTIFSKGGYGAFPVLVAARLYRIPVMIHESDAVPGIVSLWARKFARRIAVAFPSAAASFPEEKTAVVGNPIRKRILGGNRDNARDYFSLVSAKPVILVIAGSQGALPINQMIIAGLANFAKEFEIIHQTGPAHFADIAAESSVILTTAEDKTSYHPFPFLGESQLRDAYAACDLIIARPGSTIFEIAAVAKPSILIPLPHAAQDHQRENAYAYARVSGAVVIEEANATPNLVLHTLKRIFESPDEIKRMADGAARFARTDSAEVIARELLNLALRH